MLNIVLNDYLNRLFPEHRDEFLQMIPPVELPFKSAAQQAAYERHLYFAEQMVRTNHLDDYSSVTSSYDYSVFE